MLTSFSRQHKGIQKTQFYRNLRSSQFPRKTFIFQNGFSPKAVQPEVPGFREIQKPIWRYFVMKLPSNLPSNVEKWTFRCHVRPDPAKVRDNVFVCSVRSPWTPPDLPTFNLNCEKTVFVKNSIFQLSSGFLFFWGPIVCKK